MIFGGRLLTVMEGGEWEHVLARDGVNVYRKQMLDANGQGSKFYCIKAVSTIDARATDIYELLKDPQRISEYNDECADAEELPPLSSDTRLTWASSKKYGPFKPRDFITRTHHRCSHHPPTLLHPRFKKMLIMDSSCRQMKDGTLIVMSQSEDVDFQRSGKDAYVRTEVLLAGNVMRENPSDPSKTDFVTIAHINPGGAAGDGPLPILRCQFTSFNMLRERCASHSSGSLISAWPARNATAAFDPNCVSDLARVGKPSDSCPCFRDTPGSQDCQPLVHTRAGQLYPQARECCRQTANARAVRPQA